MREGWTKVFEGDVWHARIIQNELEGEGLPAFATDPQFETPNPFVSGVGLELAAVFVPDEHAARAREIVARPRPRTQER